MPDSDQPRVRNYCHFLDPRKHNRNVGCRRHDNAYGVAGGGGERDRRRADVALFRHMRAQHDPMAWPALVACLACGWFFFNYHPGRWLWRGQLVRRFARAPD